MRHTVQQRWNGLSNRERIAVSGLGIMAAATLFFVLIVDPLLDQIDRLDRQVTAKQRAIHQLAALGADYSIARAQQAAFDKRIAAGKGTFSLLSYLEEAASAAQIRDRIAAMQPHASLSNQGYKETSVELRLEGVPFSRLLMLLGRLEDSPYLLQAKRLQVRPRLDAPQMFDATLSVSTYDKE